MIGGILGRRFLGIGLAAICAWGISSGAEAGQTPAQPLRFDTMVTEATRARIQAAFDATLTSAPHRRATLGLAVFNMATSKPLVEFRSEERLIPASVTKVFTTAYAWHVMGPEHRFSTAIGVAPGGRIVVAGSFDPTFGSSRTTGAPTSASLLESIGLALDHYAAHAPAGEKLPLTSAVNSISDPVPGPWDWEDLGDYYGAGVHRLNWHDNLFEARFRPGAAVGKPADLATMAPPPVWPVDSFVGTGPPASGDRTTFRFVLGQRRMVARGTVPLDAPEFVVRATLPDPARTFLEQARLAVPEARRARYTVEDAPEPLDESRPFVRTLWTSQSPPLLEIVRTIHLQSFNMYAEALLVAAALHADASPAVEEPPDGFEMASRRRANWLGSLGLDPTALRLRDGSGLSNSNRIAAGETARFFCAMASSDAGRQWLATLSLYGKEGDLAKRSEPSTRLAGRMRAKTGLLTGTRTLAGWVPAPDQLRAPALAFAVFVQGSDAQWTQVDRDIDQFLGVAVPALQDDTR